MPYPAPSTPQRSYRVFPSPVTGYVIDGRWEVIESVGIDVVNLVTNPSVELNTTGYSAQGAAAIARDSTDQRRGVYSLKITPTSAQLDGALYATVSLVGGSTYTFPFDLKGAGGVKYRFYVASTVNNAISPVVSVTATGRWQRVHVTFREPNTPGVAILRRLYITKDYSTSTAPFWIDGLAVYALPYPVTYFDGDSVGFVIGRNDFFWNGTRHGSTSTMTSFTRAGGKITPFSKFGFAVLALMGLGMQPILNVSTPQAFIGGSQYQRTVSQDRVFDIVGALTGGSLQELQAKRRKFLDLFKPDATPTDTPLLLLYTPVDECGEAIGETLEIPCVYESGLQGKTDNHYQENIGLRFHSFLPYLANATGDNGSSLGYQKIISATTFNVQRSSGGVWSTVALNSFSSSIRYNPFNGLVYYGGSFSSPANQIVTQDHSGNLSGLGSGPGLAVDEIAFSPNGNVFVSGGGDARIRQWDGVVWTTVGTITGTLLRGVAVNIKNGTLYAFGDFTAVNGVAAVDIARYVSGAWQAIGVPVTTQITSALILDDDDIYIGGDLAVYHWNGSTWTSIGATSSATNILELGLDGKLYAGGNGWASIGGVSANSAAYYNYVSWFALSGGLTGLSGNVFDIAFGPDGLIYYSGNFNVAGSLNLPDQAAIWNGSAWVYLALDLPGNPSIRAIEITPDERIFVSHDTSGNAVIPAVTSVLNGGSSSVSPVFTMTGPGIVYEIKNYTTDETLFFNLTLNTGEVAILDLTPGKMKFYSNFRSNLLGTILPGSDLATFRLAPGNNSISVFIAGSVTASTAITMCWRNCHWSIDSAVDTP